MLFINEIKSLIVSKKWNIILFCGLWHRLKSAKSKFWPKKWNLDFFRVN